MLHTTAITVAYAEDHVMFRAALSQNLENTGKINVMIQADDGAMLIRAMQTAAQLPQVVLMDIEMPEMNGFDASKYIKKHWPQIKILALTGHESEPYLHKIIRCGADGYIVKRADTPELVHAISTLHNEGVYNTELLSDGLLSFRHTNPDDAGFTPMELWLLKLSIVEKTVEELARTIGHKPQSVNSTLYRLYKKVGVSTAKGLLLYAIKYGFVTPDDFQ